MTRCPLRLVLYDGAVHEPLDAMDRLLGLREVTTALRLLAWHGTHPDFISPPLALRIHAPSTPVTRSRPLRRS